MGEEEEALGGKGERREGRFGRRRRRKKERHRMGNLPASSVSPIRMSLVMTVWWRGSGSTSICFGWSACKCDKCQS